MDFIELTVSLVPRDPWAEILVAELAEYGFDSFIDTKEGIQAYGPALQVDIDNAIAYTKLSSEEQDVKVSFEQKLIPHQNWNAQWESEFQPVEVDHHLTIVAPFHDKKEQQGMVVEIQPQMSFGTGHHQTTWLMVKALFELGEVPEVVLDMGTGTGILAIVAEKLGAKSVLAIDIEDWSIENAVENVARNNCEAIECKCGDIDLIAKKEFGLILANINKNVLKAQMEQYSAASRNGDVLIMSGFFESDVDEIVIFAKRKGFELNKIYTKESWAAVRMIRLPGE
jgi:ribosomal protein L11 methyltransferase